MSKYSEIEIGDTVQVIKGFLKGRFGVVTEITGDFRKYPYRILFQPEGHNITKASSDIKKI